MPVASTRRWIALLVAPAVVPVVALLPATPAGAAVLYPPGCGRGDVQHWDAYNTYTYTAGGACQASPDNGHFVQFQGDGNFVVYNSQSSANRATWAANTRGLGWYLVFGSDGRVAVQDSTHAQRWENGVRISSDYLLTLVMQDDGNLVEYAQPRTGGAVRAVWNTRTRGH